MKTTSQRTFPVKRFQHLPHNSEVEESLIASALLDNALEITEAVTTNDFYVDKYKTIFDGIAELVSNKAPVDLVTVNNHLKEKGQLEKCGGAAFLAQLIDTAPVAVNVSHYCSILKGLSIRREVIFKCHALSKKAFEGIDDLSEAAARMFKDIDAGSLENRNTASFKDLAYSRLEHWESLKEKGFPGVPTGFLTIDAITGGWQNAELIILAGRPSMGKSSLAMAFAEGAASNSFPVAVVTLEMSPGQLFDRSTAKHAKINTQTFRMGGFTTNDWKKILNTLDVFSGLPITSVHPG